MSGIVLSPLNVVFNSYNCVSRILLLLRFRTKGKSSNLLKATRLVRDRTRTKAAMDKELQLAFKIIVDNFILLPHKLEATRVWSSQHMSYTLKLEQRIYSSGEYKRNY